MFLQSPLLILRFLLVSAIQRLPIHGEQQKLTYSCPFPGKCLRIKRISFEGTQKIPFVLILLTTFPFFITTMHVRYQVITVPSLFSLEMLVQTAKRIIQNPHVLPIHNIPISCLRLKRRWHITFMPFSSEIFLLLYFERVPSNGESLVLPNT